MSTDLRRMRMLFDDMGIPYSVMENGEIAEVRTGNVRFIFKNGDFQGYLDELGLSMKGKYAERYST